MDAPSSSPFVLTATELDYLLPASAIARDRLRLQAAADENLQRAAEGSLFARGLIGAAEEPVLSKTATEIVAALTSPVSWVEVGLATQFAAGGFQIFEGAESRIQVEAQPFDSFSITRIESGQSLADAVVGYADSVLGGDAPTAILVRTGIGPAPADEDLAIRRSVAGEIDFAQGNVETSPLASTTREGAQEILREYLSAARS